VRGLERELLEDLHQGSRDSLVGSDQPGTVVPWIVNASRRGKNGW